MADGAVLHALISRLEAETSGAFFLDREVWAAIAGRPAIKPPAYTVSLDAALTLVPEGWFWRVGRTSSFQAWAVVHQTHPDHGERDRNEFVFRREYWEPKSTPALALCIAALKARAAHA